jgi:hypothetical protein
MAMTSHGKVKIEEAGRKEEGAPEVLATTTRAQGRASADSSFLLAMDVVEPLEVELLSMTASLLAADVGYRDGGLPLPLKAELLAAEVV